MKIVNHSNTRENWHDVLYSWNKVLNWNHYNYSESQLKKEIKTLIIFLWNEKDWIKKRYPLKGNGIERNVNKSNILK